MTVEIDTEAREGTVLAIEHGGSVVVLLCQAADGDLFSIPFDWRSYRALEETQGDLHGRLVEWDEDEHQITFGD